MSAVRLGHREHTGDDHRSQRGFDDSLRKEVVKESIDFPGGR